MVKEQSENVKKGKFEVISSLFKVVTIPWCSWRKRRRTKYVYMCLSILLDNQVNIILFNKLKLIKNYFFLYNIIVSIF